MLADVPCTHPLEERRPVYAGRPLPLPGRSFCALCGEVLSEDVSGLPAETVAIAS